MPYSPYNDYFSTESMTWNFAKELPTLSMHWKVIPKLESTLPEGLLPDAGIPNPIQELTHKRKRNYDNSNLIFRIGHRILGNTLTYLLVVAH